MNAGTKNAIILSFQQIDLQFHAIFYLYIQADFSSLPRMEHTMTVAQLFNKLSAFYATARFIAVFIRAAIGVYHEPDQSYTLFV